MRLSEWGNFYILDVTRKINDSNNPVVTRLREELEEAREIMKCLVVLEYSDHVDYRLDLGSMIAGGPAAESSYGP